MTFRFGSSFRSFGRETPSPITSMSLDIVGSSGVGKKTLITSFFFLKSENSIKDCMVQCTFNNKKYRFNISKLPRPGPNSRNVIICYAINDRDSFKEAENIAKSRPFDQISLVALKCDLYNSCPNFVSSDEGIDLMKRIHSPIYIEVSSILSVNNDKPFLMNIIYFMVEKTGRGIILYRTGHPLLPSIQTTSDDDESYDYDDYYSDYSDD